jgi:hypothetical protein
VTKAQIEEMASADEFEVVKEVQVSIARLTLCPLSRFEERRVGFQMWCAQLHSLPGVWHADGFDGNELEVFGRLRARKGVSREWADAIQEFFADFLAQYPSLFALTQASLADGGEGPSNVGSPALLLCRQAPRSQRVISFVESPDTILASALLTATHAHASSGAGVAH